jgi:ABC-type multidrug transport system fused ATPase/permease subunit
LFSYCQDYSLNRTSQELAFDLRAALYAQIQRLSLGFHERQRTGDLITRVTRDIDRVQDFLSGSLFKMLASVLSILGMFAVMLWMDWVLALAAFILAPVLFGIVYYYTSRIKELSRLQRKQEGALASVAQEAISAARVVRAFAQEERENERFQKHGKRSLEAGVEVARLEAQFGWLANVLTALGTAAVLVLGVGRVLAGSVTPGDLIVFAAYLNRLYKPMRTFSRELTKLSRALVCAERVDEVLDADPGVTDEPGARPAPRFRGRLSFEAVSFAYQRGQIVLRDVSFAVEPGQTVALVGATGAGKSSLAALIPRFYDPFEGRVLIDGTDIRCFTLRSLRGQISLVLQESVLFRATIAENIAYGNPIAGPANILAAARAAHADEFIRALPEGYETVVGERGATLSGGQRQRIAIARALIRDAPILILDEPATGLDAATEALLLDALRRLMAGRTTVLIAHNLSTVESANLILVLDEGRIVERGTHAELLARRGPYYDLYSLQARTREGFWGAPSR